MNDHAPPARLVPAGASLTLAPNAPRMAFETDGKALRLGPSFDARNLRYDAEGGPTALTMTDQGYAYQPHWPAFTALLDARGDTGPASVAARKLAQAPVDSTAPEIGFAHSPARSLLLRLVTRTAYDAKKTALLAWNTDMPFLTYWKALKAADRQKLAEAEGPALLELALLTHRFLVAETLWKAGARLGREELERGHVLFALADNVLEATPSLAMLLAMQKASKPYREALASSLSEDEHQAFDPWLTAKEENTVGLAQLAAHFQRWLSRLAEQGVNANATLPFTVKFPNENRTRETQDRAFPLFLQALRVSDWHQAWTGSNNPSQETLAERVARLWSDAMLDLRFDPSQPLMDTWQDQEVAFVEWLDTLRMREAVVLPWKARLLETQLGSGLVQRKTRF